MGGGNLKCLLCQDLVQGNPQQVRQACHCHRKLASELEVIQGTADGCSNLMQEQNR